MSSSLHAIEAAAFLLPPEERARLAARLIASLERNPEVETAQQEEIRRRIAEFEAGVTESLPAETVFEEARDRLGAQSRVEFLTAASEELLIGVDFYESEAPGLGAEFIRDLEASIELVSELPSLGSPGPQDTRRIHLHRFPYSLTYRRESDLLRVIAVEHDRSKPGFWKDRVQTYGSKSSSVERRRFLS